MAPTCPLTNPYYEGPKRKKKFHINSDILFYKHIECITYLIQTQDSTCYSYNAALSQRTKYNCMTDYKEAGRQVKKCAKMVV